MGSGKFYLPQMNHKSRFFQSIYNFTLKSKNWKLRRNSTEVAISVNPVGNRDWNVFLNVGFGGKLVRCYRYLCGPDSLISSSLLSWWTGVKLLVLGSYCSNRFISNVPQSTERLYMVPWISLQWRIHEGGANLFFQLFLLKTAWKWKKWDRGCASMAPPWICHCFVSLFRCGSRILPMREGANLEAESYQHSEAESGEQNKLKWAQTL